MRLCVLFQLKKENSALQQEVNKLSCAPKNQPSEAIETCVEENMNKVELDLAKKKITSLEEELQQKTEVCNAERTKRAQYEEKMEKFEMELEKSYKTIREQKKELADNLKQIQENLDTKDALVKQQIEKNNKLEQNLLEIIMDKKALSESISGLTCTLDEVTNSLFAPFTVIYWCFREISFWKTIKNNYINSSLKIKRVNTNAKPTL